MHTVVYSKSARADLRKLEFKIARRIVKKVHFFSSQKNPLVFAKPLRNLSLGQYRFRVGDYRVLFDVDKEGTIQILLVLRIKHRKDVYEL